MLHSVTWSHLLSHISERKLLLRPTSESAREITPESPMQLPVRLSASSTELPRRPFARAVAPVSHKSTAGTYRAEVLLELIRRAQSLRGRGPVGLLKRVGEACYCCTSICTYGRPIREAVVLCCI